MSGAAVADLSGFYPAPAIMLLDAGQFGLLLDFYFAYQHSGIEGAAADFAKGRTGKV